LKSPSQLLKFAAKNEGAEMMLLYALLHRLASLLPKKEVDSKLRDALAEDGRFQVWMKTLSSRAAECNSTTLARLADGLVRLRVKSPETQEVLQELAEDLSILAQAFASWRHGESGPKVAQFLRAEAMRQMQDFKWNSCVRFLEAFRRWGIVDHELTAMTLERLQDILPNATNRDVTMLLETLSKLGIAKLELLQKLCQLTFGSLWLFTPQQLVSISSSLAKLRFLTQRDVEELLKALTPQLGRLSTAELARLLFAIALSPRGETRDFPLEVLAAQYVAGEVCSMEEDIDVMWALLVLELDGYMPALIARLKESTESDGFVHLSRTRFVKLNDVLLYLSHLGDKTTWPTALCQAAKEAAAVEARHLATSSVRQQVVLCCEGLYPGERSQKAGAFHVDFLDPRSKVVVDVDTISWPITRELRHRMLRSEDYTTVLVPLGGKEDEI